MVQDRIHFEEFLWESFCEGQAVRELRLSQAELSYLETRYPLASYSTESVEANGKTWYVITLHRRDPLQACGA